MLARLLWCPEICPPPEHVFLLLKNMPGRLPLVTVLGLYLWRWGLGLGLLGLSDG